MRTDRELEILFPTSFSDSCFRLIPAIAQFVEELRVRITLLHVYDPAETTRTEAEEQLQSFFGEAEYYGACRRIVTDGRPASVIRQFCRQEKMDLIMAPATDRIGLPRFNHRSIRAELLQSVAVPLWTAASKSEKRDFSQRIRNVACWVDFDCANITHLRNAANLALRLSAKLHIVHAVPNVHEGILATVLTSDKPLHPNVAIERIRSLTSWMPIRPEVHVSIGDNRREIPRLLQACDADVVFLGENQAIRQRFGRPAMMPWVDALPCPAVCFDGASKEGIEWSLDPRHAAVQEMAPSQQPSVAPSLTPA
jgi:nucleotide-binding universal stress UspA family protein